MSLAKQLRERCTWETSNPAVNDLLAAASELEQYETALKLSTEYAGARLDALNGLIGLMQLICGRPDMPQEIRQAVQDNHRWYTAAKVSAEAKTIPEIVRPCPHPVSHIRTIGGERHECGVCKASRYRLNDRGEWGPWLESRQPQEGHAVGTLSDAQKLRNIWAAYDYETRLDAAALADKFRDAGDAQYQRGEQTIVTALTFSREEWETLNGRLSQGIVQPKVSGRCFRCGLDVTLNEPEHALTDAEAIKEFKDRFPPPPNPRAKV
jgi:hypothetical protein